MTGKFILGRYVPADSLLHRMDPRAKLILIFLFVCVVFVANNPVTYGILLLYTFAMALLSKVPLRFILGGLKPILWLILFTFLLHLFLTRDGDVLFSISRLEIYEGGVRQEFSFPCAFSCSS